MSGKACVRSAEGKRAEEDGLPPPGGPAGAAERVLLDTAEAAAYVRLAASTLEKRRVTGLNSPPYIQTVARGAVRYRISDLDAWLDARTYHNTSER